MIGYDRLGTNGRFGNQLFQYAALRGIAAHHGYEFCIPPDDHPTYANYGMHHPFKLPHLKHQGFVNKNNSCLLYTSPSPRDRQKSRMPSSA